MKNLTSITFLLALVLGCSNEKEFLTGEYIGINLTRVYPVGANSNEYTETIDTNEYYCFARDSVYFESYFRNDTLSDSYSYKLTKDSLILFHERTLKPGTIFFANRFVRVEDRFVEDTYTHEFLTGKNPLESVYWRLTLVKK